MNNLDTSRLPPATHKMVRAYYGMGYRLTRPDVPNALKLTKGDLRPVYIVSVNKKGKAGPFIGVAFVRA